MPFKNKLSIHQMAQYLFLLFLVFSFTTTTFSNQTKSSKFSAIFYFGDSTLDTGNNGFIETLVEASHIPYGQDFPGGKPTGRFSNGLLVPDLLSSKLGVAKFSSPFLDPKLSNEDLKRGANFASAGSGFDEATSHLFNTLPMSKQLEMFRKYIVRLEENEGKEEARKIVDDSLIFVSAGTNDFTKNYYHTSNKSLESIGAYQDFIIDKVEMSLKELYNLGSRSFCIASLGPFGCTPMQITLKDPPKRECVAEMNNDAITYNSKLKDLLHNLEQNLNGSKFIYMDAYDSFMDILNHASLHGFKETTKGCCATGLIEVGPLCSVLTPTCKNVSNYLFFDAVHPTQRVYQLLTESILKSIAPLLQ